MVEEIRNPFPVQPANPETVQKLCRHLVAAFEEYCNTAVEELPYMDALMGVHNFHKAIVLDVIDRTQHQSPVPEVYAMAMRKMVSDTWFVAMMEGAGRD